MYRVHRHARLHTAGPAMLRTSLCCYTPIFAPEPAADHLAPLRTSDERQALWVNSLPVPDVSRGVETWLRFGNDPVVHTAFPNTVPKDARLLSSAATVDGGATTPSSPFAFVEDYMGTNLVFGQAGHIKQSAEVWTSFFERRYLARLRQSRRTSANFIGQSNVNNGSSAAAGLFTDEADMPSTKWSADTQFGEVAFLSERHLKEKVSNMEQLEYALWEKAGPEAFCAFFESFQQQTQTRVPLPVASVWYYEGEARKKWVETYIPLAHAARAFFDASLKPAVNTLTQEKLLAAVADALKGVHAIAARRAERQMKQKLRPDWGSATAKEKALWCEAEIEREHRGLVEGCYDPENLLDNTEEWKTESNEMQALLDKKIDGCSFTLQEFWLHTTRREAMETQHVLDEEELRELAAAALSALYDEHSVAEVFQGNEDAVRRGVLDLRAAIFKPSFTPVWCKLNYVKFGGSSIVQHTTTASRQMLFNYAHSPQQIAASASLYYATKPLSSQLDYASPYTLRRSLVRLCSTYGLDMTHAAQRPLLLSAANLAKAEGTVATVVRNVALPFGERRRARETAVRASVQRLLSPVTAVSVCAPATELLDAGAAADALEPALRPAAAARSGNGSSDDDKAGQEMIAMWPLGSRQAVRYCWPVAYMEKICAVTQAGPLTAERVSELQVLRHKGRLEISLWRRRTPEEVTAVNESAAAAEKACAASVAASAEMANVKVYAENLYRHLTGEGQKAVPTASFGVKAGESSNNDWVFAVMLDDNAPLSLAEQVEVYLPFTTTVARADGSLETVLLPQGEYRVRVRAYDTEASLRASTRSSSSVDDQSGVDMTSEVVLCSEAFSPAFPVFDAIPQLVDQFSQQKRGGSTKTKEGSSSSSMPETIKGEDLIAFCEFLRTAGLDVPLRCEFAAGQCVDAHGNIPLSHLLHLLRGNDFHRANCEAGITTVQRGVEANVRAHWALYHPGATEEEWAVARRRELTRAMTEERSWWLPDPLLEVRDPVTMNGSEDLSMNTYPAVARYGTELCAVLQASGSNQHGSRNSGSNSSSVSNTKLAAECSVDGTGALTSLTLGGGATTSATDVTMEAALSAALAAVQDAQTRHNTLSMFKLGPLEKQAQVMLFCGVHGFEFGGKYARTYCYAADKAKRGIAESTVSGRVATSAVADAEKERVSEQSKVDRFASQTNPEQRITRFRPRITLSNANMEDPTPDQTTSWGR